MYRVNYGPVSVIPSISKFFEKLTQKQISGYISNFVSPSLSVYGKASILLALLENWKKVIDKDGFGRAVLMDLSKTFDIIKHDLPKAQIYAYSFNKESLELLHS